MGIETRWRTTCVATEAKKKSPTKKKEKIDVDNRDLLIEIPV
jgi:hypothetical protein